MIEQVKQYVISGIPLYIWNGIITFITVLVVGLFIKFFLQILGKKIFVKTKTELDDQILRAVLIRLRGLTFVIAFYLAIKEICNGIAKTDQIGRHFLVYAEGILFVVFIFLLTMLVVRIIDISLKHLIHKHAKHASETINKALLPLLNKLTIIVVLFIAAVITLGHFGINVSSLLVFLGGGSVAIALAAQETLANMIAGFVIMIDRPFRVGDRIKLPSGEIGDVYEIGLRSTSILDFDNNLIISPNTELTKAKIINFSYPNKESRVLVEVSVAYGTPIEVAQDIMLKQAAKISDILDTPPPFILFSAMKESACILQLICRVDNLEKKGFVEAALRENIYTQFLKAGISSGYTTHLVKIPSEIKDAPPKSD